MPKETFFNLPPEKRNKFIEIAIDEFAAHDYKTASISRIANRAGIAKGSLYQYFENKLELYHYLTGLVVEEKRRFFQTQTAPDAQMDLFAYLRWLLRQSIVFELRYPRLVQLGYRAAYGSEAINDEIRRQAVDASADLFTDLIRRGVAQGNLTAEIDPHLMAFVFKTLFSELGPYLQTRFPIDPARLNEAGYFAAYIAQIEPTFDALLRLLEHGTGNAGHV